MPEAVLNYNSEQVSFYNPKIFATFSIARKSNLYLKCGHNFKKTVYFNDMVHLMDEEKIVGSVDFACAINFYREAPTKVQLINQELTDYCKSWKNPECILINDQRNCFTVDENASNIFGGQWKISYMDPAAFTSLNNIAEKVF